MPLSPPTEAARRGAQRVREKERGAPLAFLSLSQVFFLFLSDGPVNGFVYFSISIVLESVTNDALRKLCRRSPGVLFVFFPRQRREGTLIHCRSQRRTKQGAEGARESPARGEKQTRRNGFAASKPRPPPSPHPPPSPSFKHTSSKNKPTNQKQAGQPVPVRTATLRDLTPTDKAKVSRLLRRVLSLSADNERLSSSAAATAAAREGEAAELRKRLDAALDSLSEARRRAETAEARLRAAVGSCVCGAAAGAEVGGGARGARGGEGGGERDENRENFGRSSGNAPTATATTATAKGRRTLVFNESKGAFEFEAPRGGEEEEEEEPRRRAGAASRGGSGAPTVAPAFPPPPPPKQQQQRRGERESKSLQALVADVEASLAAAALRR